MKSERGHSVAAAYRKLRQMIIAGQLPPGGWLIEAELANRLGISRTPLRAALQALQKEGYVRSSGGGVKSRMSIAPLTGEDAQELYSIIGHLEGLAARLTAELPEDRRRQISARLAGFNRGLTQQSRERRPDPDCIFELDLNFHRAVVEAGAGPRLLELHGTVQPQAERYWRLYAAAILDELKESVREHAAIIQALEAGDSAAAELGVQINWMNGAARLAKVIESRGERGNW